jgi:hypothetical protein
MFEKKNQSKPFLSGAESDLILLFENSSEKIWMPHWRAII